MSDRHLIIAGFITILIVAVAAAVVSRWQRARVASLGEVLGHLTGPRGLRLTAVALWGMLGWHFLAR